ncbi:AraC-like DNA-binding protein [Erwinia toletana]|uniref:AraC-like DNA-binding protein n=1 Tax=Winslowiella toletana TaxID=92490 RepID=A0ABS4P9Q2_9GAMM|nr:AraC family transcriptional regulator [Winslowiella toletana]MBP2169359.1 AraC-like DNA-binding protein [Winslowiella toletana]
MQGVPQQFPCEKDRARFRHLPEMPGVELYHAHISSYAFEPHTHEAFGMGTIDYGAERFRYRGSNHVAPTHSLVLMNPDELHTGESATLDGWRYRMIYIEPQVMEALSGEQGWWFTDAVREDLATSQQLSHTLAELWQAGDSLAIEGHMLSIMQLLRPHARVATKLIAEPAQRFDIIREYLREHFTRNITLAELSTLVSLSPYHFLRQFKRQYHVTPHQMLMAFRLYEAKQLLTRGIAAAEVAATVGLSDQAHLTRTFAQRYGITPIRYQKQVTGGRQ